MNGPLSIAYRELPIQFANRTDALAGILCLPHTTPPYPAVAFVHGSGAQARDGLTMFPPIWEALAQRGIASLAWDKPGVGQSTGQWWHQTVHDRANECLAAIEFLKQQPEIAPDKVGVWGSSQAGWIMPLAYATDPSAIAFMIANSVAIDGERQELYRLAHQLPADGYSQAEATKAVAYTELCFAFGHLNLTYDLYASLLRLVEDAPWRDEAIVLQPEEYEHFKRDLKPDPQFRPIAEYLEQLRCPVLLIFGERDTLVDIQESIRVYQAALQQAGNPDVTIRVFAGADHCLFPSTTGGMQEMRRMWQAAETSFVTGYLETVAEWVGARFG
jgi:uncharacterized protein